jgi:ribosomal protein L19E
LRVRHHQENHDAATSLVPPTKEARQVQYVMALVYVQVCVNKPSKANAAGRKRIGFSPTKGRQKGHGDPAGKRLLFEDLPPV